jgi:hypothetical protein
MRNLERAVELDPRNVWLLTDVAQTCEFQRHFSEAAAAWDRTLTVVPSDPSTRVARALIDLKSSAETRPGHEVTQHLVTEDPSAVDMTAELWLDLALCRRDPAEMASALSLYLQKESFAATCACLAPFLRAGPRTLETMRRVLRQHLPRRVLKWKR